MESERSNNTSLHVSLTNEEEFDPQYEKESVQEKSKTCSLCNKSNSLFKPNGANLESVNNDARLNPKEEKDRVKKFFKKLSNKLQDFNLFLVRNMKMRNPTTPDMVFVKLHNKILNAEKKLVEYNLFILVKLQKSCLI
ncbi:hypothetical protein GLOIN_2v1475865 [Rhizophagus clarus]|uniref:Uncharacterized protein n=1 Tax=Rhizophagus clarus TaxID=94130 RepID=A0A8H3LNU8_9GLOM|nr:hypothetical protein GLOIN_2v1475865 [Rhizophagus clarus]